MRISFIFILLALVGCAEGARETSDQDPRLSALRTVLMPMRDQPDDDDSPGRGATPELRHAETMLRDWVERELGAFPADGNEAALARDLNQRLRAADLLCSTVSDSAADRCTAYSDPSHARGYLEDVALRRVDDGRLLLLKIGAGVICGFDDAAALYERHGERWRRIWESGPDAPDAIALAQEIEVSAPRDGRSNRLVLAYGFDYGCVSFWHSVNYRLWRVAADGSRQALLLDRDEWAYIDPPIAGRVGPDEALVEFATTGFVAGFSRQAVRHYRIRGAALDRIDPIALGPTNFVAEWLDAPWAESRRWTTPAARRRLRTWHLRLGQAELPFDTARRCRGAPDLWQVGEGPYFLLRWRPPYHFDMADIAERPWRRCALKDPAADEYRSLFPPAASGDPPPGAG